MQMWVVVDGWGDRMPQTEVGISHASDRLKAGRTKLLGTED